MLQPPEVSWLNFQELTLFFTIAAGYMIFKQPSSFIDRCPLSKNILKANRVFGRKSCEACVFGRVRKK
jgi:hypothetical protein